MADQLGAILGQAPAPGVTDTVFDRSGGNAYLVEELAGAVAAGGDPADLPPSLGDVLLSRVDALSADGQKLLRTASVAGQAVPEPLLAEVAGLGEENCTRRCARRWTATCSSSTQAGTATPSGTR